MPIFRLQNDKLVIAAETNLELESHLEDWLENSPIALIQDEFILWIGRQTSAAVDDSTIFPDLLGVDVEGNLVIVELKRDEAPRQVVAQLLEYAAWANELSEEQIQEIAEDYFENGEEFKGKHFQDVFKDVFDIPETDEISPLNRNLRLYIVAGDIPASVVRVCRFLRTSQGMDINCIDVSTFETEAGERLVSMEAKIRDEDISASKIQRQRASQTSQWSGDKSAKQVVLEGVKELTGEDTDFEFAVKDVKKVVLEKYPNFKRSTVDGMMIADTVNHPSRHHFSSTEDYYWRVKKGKYRLYDPEKDKMENTVDSIQD